MADNGKEEGRLSQGADWEVVSLTASAYAAAPGPNDFNTTNESKEQGNITSNESSALLLSGHFVFPPCEHENLPIDPDLSNIHDEKEEYNLSTEVIDGDKDDKHNVEFSDEGSTNSIHEMLADSENDNAYSGVQKSGAMFDSIEPSDVNMDSPRDHSKPDEVEFDGSNLPCEAWWKRHITSVYRHAKDTNSFWSVVVAAAVMGIVVLSRRWQQDKGQLHRLGWRVSSTTDEKTGGMLGSIGRFKDVLIRSHHRGSLTGVGASASF